MKKNDISKAKSDKLSRLEEPNVGDLYYYDHEPNSILKIGKIHKSKYHADKRLVADMLQSEDGINWHERSHDQTKELDDLDRYYKKLYLQEGETPAQAWASLKKEFIQALINPGSLADDEEGAETEETGLVPTAGKGRYEDMAAALMRKRARADIIAHMAESRMNQLRNVAGKLAKQLQKVMRVLMIIELYLGVHEEIFQVTTGAPAPVTEPISIRQLVLHMDEEAAIVRVSNTRHGLKIEGDINWENVQAFDEWVSIPENLQVVLPEAKGIVALRPSRQDRYTDHDDFTAAQHKENDSMIYLLIRNGDNLYRVWTNIKMGNNLFPTLEESKEVEKLFSSDWEHHREDGDLAKSVWVRNALLLQGLIDRTEIFLPLPVARIDLNDPATFAHGGLVRMIRDAENLITDGHESFRDWRKRLSEGVTRGTRVYFPGLAWDRDRYKERFLMETNNPPPVPEPGIYTVEEVLEDSSFRHYKRYRILYLPDDVVWSRSWRVDSHDRTKRVSFLLYGDEIINYDDFDVESIEYFLKDRLERSDYRTLIPTLIGLRSDRLAELEKEAGFVKLLSQQHGIPEARLFEFVEWWKRKVINKRPLDADDAKAWRMIIRKAKGENII